MYLEINTPNLVLHKLRDIERFQALVIEIRRFLGQKEWLGSIAVLVDVTNIRHGVETIHATRTKDEPSAITAP